MTINLSQRLNNIALQLNPGSFFADIGSDHAYLPCYVCLRDQEAQAIAGEVAEGPYLRAVQTVKKYNLANRIIVRLGNGLEVIDPDEKVDTVIIAGMGGPLISSILQSGKDKLTTINKIIVQPNTNEKAVRQTLAQLGFFLTKELILKENNHIYEILVAENNINNNLLDPYNKATFEKEMLFGPYLLKKKTALFLEKWHQEREKLLKVVSEMKKANKMEIEKISEFEKIIYWIEEVLK